MSSENGTLDYEDALANFKAVTKTSKTQTKISPRPNKHWWKYL